MASSTMFSRKTLKSFVTKRLCAAAEEIFVVVERIITEYEDQAFSSKQQIEKQQRILDVVLKPQIKLHRTDIPEKRQRIIKKTFEVENEDDDEDFPGFPALDDSLEHEEGSSLGLEEPQSPLQGQGETGWSTLRLLDVTSRDTLSADFTVQEDASLPEIKEEPEELLIIPQIADTSSSTLTSLDRMSAVSTLPDTDSNATTASPGWPIYVMTPVEPQPQMDVEDADDEDVDVDDEDVDDEDVDDEDDEDVDDADDVDVDDVDDVDVDDVDVDYVDVVDADGVDMSPVPGMECVDRLAECLVGLRTQTGPSLNYKQTCAVTELWLNLRPYDQVRVSFSPLACNRPGALWPDCGRLVASVLGKLCDIHTIQKKYNNHDGSGCYMLKWVPVLRDYKKIRNHLRRTGAVMPSGSNLTLFDVDQLTFFDWHGQRTRMQRSSVHLQGLTAGVTTVSSGAYTETERQESNGPVVKSGKGRSRGRPRKVYRGRPRGRPLGSNNLDSCARTNAPGYVRRPGSHPIYPISQVTERQETNRPVVKRGRGRPRNVYRGRPRPVTERQEVLHWNNIDSLHLPACKEEPQEESDSSLDCGTSRPPGEEQLLCPLSYHSDTDDSDDCDDWEQTCQAQPVRKSQRKVKRERYTEDGNDLEQTWEALPGRKSRRKFKRERPLSVIDELSHDLKSSTHLKSEGQTLPTRTNKGEKALYCTFCGKKCASNAGLKTHVMIHTGEKPYGCRFCDKRFRLKGNAKGHERTHTGEKPYSCAYCGKRFTQKGNLKIHTKKYCGKDLFSSPKIEDPQA